MCDGSHPGRVRRRLELGGDLVVKGVVVVVVVVVVVLLLLLLLLVVVDFPGNTIDTGVEVKERKAKQQQQREEEWNQTLDIRHHCYHCHHHK